MSEFYDELIATCKSKNADMKEYLGLTLQLASCEMDSLNPLLDARELVVGSIVEKTRQIHKTISCFPEKDKAEIKSVINGNTLSNEKYSDLCDIISEQMILREQSLAADNNLKGILDGYHKDLMDQGMKLSKGKRLIRYVDADSKSQLLKGNGFDKKQ